MEWYNNSKGARKENILDFSAGDWLRKIETEKENFSVREISE